MEATDEVLAAREVDRGLSPDRRIDLPHERRGHGSPGNTSHPGRCREPRDVGRAPASERDDRPVPPDPERAPEVVEHSDRLRRLSRGHLVRGDVARPERELSRDTVDAGHGRVGDDLDRPVARHELAEELDRPDADVDTRGSEHDAVEVGRARICRLLVDRDSLLEAGAERALVGGERPSAPRGALPRGVHVDVDQHGKRARAQALSRLRREYGPTPERDHGWLRRVEDRCGDGLLEHSERRLTVAGEELGDRDPRASLDLAIEVDKASAEAPCDLRAHRRLARAHEAGEREVAVQGVRGHRMRSR